MDALSFPPSFTETSFSRGSRAAVAAPYTGPFALRVRSGNARVLVPGSTITDGTNGTSIDLTGVLETEVAASGTKYIAIEADVDSSLVVTNWALVAKSTAAEVEEVGIDNSDPANPFQNKVRLFIGKVVSTGGPPVSQACLAPQLLTHGLLSGLAVKVFQPHTVHPDNF